MVVRKCRPNRASLPLPVALIMQYLLLRPAAIGAFRTASSGFRRSAVRPDPIVPFVPQWIRHGPPVRSSSSAAAAAKFHSSPPQQSQDETERYVSPWNDPRLDERVKQKGYRARQHVNPLARRFQMHTELPDEWPRNVFDDMSRPFFLDIGCARGGFLVEVARQRPHQYNYLGLEIRPVVVRHAQERVRKHGLTGSLGFVGCNANVDLDRLLHLAEAKHKLEMVTIQFPDPHFKSHHAKRRVVTPQLVTTLAEYMPPDATVFLQSDIKSVLDEMRESFRLQPNLFRDEFEDVTEYHTDNLIGIPTEREASVLEKGLPVYRAVFKRTSELIADTL